MIETKEFKTRSEILERDMPKIKGNNQYKGKTVIALDGGYSAVKGVSPNKVFIFPSYAKKAPRDLEIVGKLKGTDIQFRNNTTGEVWLVGQSAETLMDQSDIDSTTDASLYSRHRYDSDVFRVIMATGLGIGLWGTGPDNELFLQTGLPATYKERDSEKLISALVGNYNISIRIGNGDWMDFVFDLDRDHIDIMEQPQGTLCAAAYDSTGVSDLGKVILRSNSIILDIGFGTEDIFSIKGGMKNSHQTFTDTAMKSVFENVIRQIEEKYPADYKVFQLQQYLENGKASYFDTDEFAQHEIEISPYLESANTELCEKSIRRLVEEYGKLEGYKYLIVTGGTGESRFEQIKKMLSGFPNLQVLPGNVNTPELAFSYSNVIGYYMLRHAKLAAEMKKAEKQ